MMYTQRRILYVYWAICLFILIAADEFIYFFALEIIALVWVHYRFYSTFEPCGLANAARDIQEQKRRERKQQKTR